MLLLSALILVLLIVSAITVMFRVGYLISLTHLCFIVFYCIYVLMYYVLICSAAQLQKCLINLPTYLLENSGNSYNSNVCNK